MSNPRTAAWGSFIYGRYVIRRLQQNFSPYISITETVNRWSLEIFNYFDHPYTNGVTEAINGCIKAIARDGKGYSFEILRGKVLYGQAYKTKAIFLIINFLRQYTM